MRYVISKSMNGIIPVIIIIFIIGACASKKEISPEKEALPEKEATQMIVSVPDLMNSSPQKVEKLLGKESMKYPIEHYNSNAQIGESRKYRKDGLIFTIEFIKNKSTYIWIELYDANISGTWQEALQRFGIKDVELIERENYRLSFSGKDYPIILIEEGTMTKFFQLEVGTTVDRGSF